jgi:hypothetical protein
MELPVAKIKHTGLRRAAMIGITPILLVMLAPALIGLVGHCIGSAWEGLLDEWAFQTNDRATELLKLAWTQVWSSEWEAGE